MFEQFSSKINSYDLPRMEELPINRLREQIRDEGAKTAEQLTQEGMRGSEQTPALKSSLEAEQIGTQALGGYINPAVNQALQKRAQRSYVSDLNRMQRQMESEKQYEKARLGMRASQAQIQFYQTELARNNFLKTQIQNRKSLRNNVISNIVSGGLSLGGAVAGGVLGGPAGAAAGSQIGAGLGGFAAPTQGVQTAGTQNNPYLNF